MSCVNIIMPMFDTREKHTMFHIFCLISVSFKFIFLFRSHLHLCNFVRDRKNRIEMTRSAIKAGGEGEGGLARVMEKTRLK